MNRLWKNCSIPYLRAAKGRAPGKVLFLWEKLNLEAERRSDYPCQYPSGDTSILADQIQTIDLSALNYDVTGEVEPSVLEQAKRILRRIID